MWPCVQMDNENKRLQSGTKKTKRSHYLCIYTWVGTPPFSEYVQSQATWQRRTKVKTWNVFRTFKRQMATSESATVLKYIIRSVTQSPLLRDQFVAAELQSQQFWISHLSTNHDFPLTTRPDLSGCFQPTRLAGCGGAASADRWISLWQ